MRGLNSIPSGILQHVLREFQHHSGLFRSGRLDQPTVDAIAAFRSFFATYGSGCDAVFEFMRDVARNQTLVGSSRCKEAPCKWVSYSLREAPETRLGVRLCSDHVSLAKPEDWWAMSDSRREEFAVWEVMTS